MLVVREVEERPGEDKQVPEEERWGRRREFGEGENEGLTRLCYLMQYCSVSVK